MPFNPGLGSLGFLCVLVNIRVVLGSNIEEPFVELKDRRGRE